MTDPVARSATTHTLALPGAESIGSTRSWPVVRWVRKAWLGALSRHPLIRHVAVPLVVAAAARFVLLVLGFQPSSPPRELATDVILVLLGYFAVRESFLWGLKTIRAHVFEIAQAAQDPGRKFLLDLATLQTAEAVKTIRGLAGDGYKVDSPELMQEWFQSFFTHGGNSYRGIDSNLPSVYVKKYDWYLDLHRQALLDIPRAGNNRDARIVEADRNSVTADYYRKGSSVAFRKFTQWHGENDVNLRWIEPETAAALRRRHGITNEADAGVWENFVAFFDDQPDDSVTLTMIFPDTTRGTLTLTQMQEYINDVYKASKPFPEQPPGVDTVDEKLAQAWSAYVDAEARIDPQGAWARFLLEVLSDHPFVLDAAGGIGAESVLLLRGGHSVVTNEVDPRLSALAEKFATQHGQRLQVTGYLWEQLGDSLPGHITFDAVLVIGNSLCLVQERDRRELCVSALYQSVKPGGVLVIDERNFAAMVQQRAAIEADPVQDFPSTLGGDILYKGTGVRGYPFEIGPTRITWRFFTYDGTALSGQDVRNLGQEFQDLSLYPFERGELFGLLRHAGFATIDVYADLKLIAEGQTEMPSNDAVDKAGFLTYVARRSSDSVAPLQETSRSEKETGTDAGVR